MFFLALLETRLQDSVEAVEAAVIEVFQGQKVQAKAIPGTCGQRVARRSLVTRWFANGKPGGGTGCKPVE